LIAKAESICQVWFLECVCDIGGLAGTKALDVERKIVPFTMGNISQILELARYTYIYYYYTTTIR
jgi:hypothetical protein